MRITHRRVGDDDTGSGQEQDARQVGFTLKLRRQHLAHGPRQVQIFHQLLRLATQAWDTRNQRVAKCPNGGIGLGHRQPPERLLAVAHGGGDGVILAHRGLAMAFDQHPLGKMAQKLQLALAAENQRLDRQRL
ncbi:hypothetical protein D3C78_1047680 [compost metagenome]